MDDRFSPPPIDSSSDLEGLTLPKRTSQAQPDPRRSAWISAQARQIFGSYQRDEFADPDSFLAQLGMILERYSDDIIRKVCSPISGIQRIYKKPPSMAAIAEMCQDETERAVRLRELSQFRVQQREPRPLGQTRTNVFVPPYAPQYVAMIEKAKTGDPREFHYDAERPGIWVALGWIRPSMGGQDAVGQTITPAMVKQQLNLTDEQWDSIPDAPHRQDAGAA